MRGAFIATRSSNVRQSWPLYSKSMPRYLPLSLGAQASYSELFDMAQSNDLVPFAGLKGAFHKRVINKRTYVYFGYRDVDGTGRMAYVGPDNERVNALIAKAGRAAVSDAQELLRQRAEASRALGCQPMLDKHFRIVKKLSSYGFFKAGGVLIGTHAFVAYGNMLGVRWGDGARTLDVDFAHAGRNISVALPADLRMSVHDALTSLEMGLLPLREFSGVAGAQYRNPDDPELRIDFLTPESRGGGLVEMASLGLSLEPLKFMEFSLEDTTQAAVFSTSGACVVNLPDPARFAVHKLIVHGERPVAERAKSNKDIDQVAALVEWHRDAGQLPRLEAAWNNAVTRGPGWRRRAEEGANALAARHPDLAASFSQVPPQVAASPKPAGKRAPRS